MFLWRKEVGDAVLNECLQKAEALSKSRAFDEAKEYYEKAVKRCDELLESALKSDYLHYRKARILYELRRFEGPDSLYVKRCKDALAEIDKAIELDPEDNGYHFLRCEILEELSKPPEWSLDASADEERIMDVWLFFFSLSHFVRGFMVDARGAPLKYSGGKDEPIDIRLIETKDDYELCLEEHPNNPDCYNNLAATLHELGIWDMRADPRALEKLNKAISLNPSNPAYYNNRALVLYSLIMDALVFRRREGGWLKDKDPEKMLQDIFRDLRRAVEQDPRNPYYHYNMGLMLYEDEKYEEAGEVFDKAIALNPSNSYLHYKKGIVFYRLGKYGEALEQFKEALRLDEDNRVAKYMIKLVERVRNKAHALAH